MTISLAYEFTLTAELAPSVPIGAGPFGERRIRKVMGGRVEGTRISGTVDTGGGDWILTGEDRYGRLDVRLTILTGDGACLYVQYFGVIEYNAAAMAANAGERSSEFTEHYFRIAPRLETGDPRYAWVNRTLFVGEGRLHPGPLVEYRVARVE
jgi:hypothetical protein